MSAPVARSQGSEAPEGASSTPNQRSHRLAVGFRALMEAMARPGRLRVAPRFADDPAPLSHAATAAVCVLVDEDAPLWLAPELAADPTLRRRLSFECGAAFAQTPGAADFLLGPWAALSERLLEARQGDPERPDLGATLILETTALSETPMDGALGLDLQGPGVAPGAPTRLWIGGVDADLPLFLERNRAEFPLGLDLILTAEDRVAALPRSIRATAL